MHSYPHMCRLHHQEIGHSDSEHEECPLCRALSDNGFLREALEWILDPPWGEDWSYAAIRDVAQKAIRATEGKTDAR